ncbi:MAG: type II toxin-antitoxin system VapC family toxin [Solirubrobacterales bacterium]
MADLLVDTDVFVDHLRGERELRGGDDAISYSVITRAELFAGAHEEEERVARLLWPFRELEVERDTAALAGRLRRETGVRLPDALIAATALRNDLLLLTRNPRDFERVSDLELIDPSAR